MNSNKKSNSNNGGNNYDTKYIEYDYDRQNCKN